MQTLEDTTQKLSPSDFVAARFHAWMDAVRSSMPLSLQDSLEQARSAAGARRPPVTPEQVALGAALADGGRLVYGTLPSRDLAAALYAGVAKRAHAALWALMEGELARIRDSVARGYPDHRVDGTRFDFSSASLLWTTDTRLHHVAVDRSADRQWESVVEYAGGPGLVVVQVGTTDVAAASQSVADLARWRVDNVRGSATWLVDTHELPFQPSRSRSLADLMRGAARVGGGPVAADAPRPADDFVMPDAPRWSDPRPATSAGRCAVCQKAIAKGDEIRFRGFEKPPVRAHAACVAES